MAKARLVFVCRECGTDHPKWQGQCVNCMAWNSLEESSVSGSANTSAGPRAGYAGERASVKRLAEVGAEDQPRLATGSEELDRVLGGGLVPGSVVLIGGEPGAGKSTLLLQVCGTLSGRAKVLYVTGEESLGQVAMRARRLQVSADNMLLASETRVEALLELIAREQPDLVVVDSIQVMTVEHAQSAAGSVAQVRESAAALTRVAKQNGPVIVLVGHVTKEGGLAGPKVLEHMIDTFLMLDASSDPRYRTLRAQKNRFGAVNELGVFAMTERGLREVSNPSAIFLARADEIAPGSLVTVTWEGTRALLLEIQALVDPMQGGNARRVAVGMDGPRFAMQLAVLHRHGGLAIGDHDVYANVVGGVRISETASDLALQLAVVSSFRNRVLARDLVAFGEVGLAGEIRPVPNGQERLREAAKHGFKRAIVPTGNVPKGGAVKRDAGGMEIIAVARLGEAIDAAF